MHRFGLVLVALLACQRNAVTAPPEPAPEADSSQNGPDVGEFAFVSEHDDTEADMPDDDASSGDDTDPALASGGVTSADQARTLAQAAVADQLDRKKQWKTSPVLPAAWPTKDARAMFLFYPMALHPETMERYELYSAQWAVVVNLDDGATEVTAIPKSRRLGTIDSGRPTSLERRELDQAEAALIVLLRGGEAMAGENRFWGYLKYFHEHPKIGADIKQRRPGFVKWLHSRPHHT